MFMHLTPPLPPPLTPRLCTDSHCLCTCNHKLSPCSRVSSHSSRMASDCVSWSPWVLLWRLATTSVGRETPFLMLTLLTLASMQTPKAFLPDLCCSQLSESIWLHGFKSQEEGPSDRVDRHRQAQGCGTVNSAGSDCSPEVLSCSDSPLSHPFIASAYPHSIFISLGL